VNRHLEPGQDGAELQLTAKGSLPKAWKELADNAPGRQTLHDPDEGWLTRGQLDERSARFAGRLYGAGLRTGDRVIVSSTASANLVAAHVACLRLGLIVVPVNGAYQQAEITHIVDDAAPRGAIVDDPIRQSWITAAAPNAVVTGPSLPLPNGSAPSLDLADAEAPAVIGYTSGTTGRPKGAVLSHANLLAGAEAVRLAWRWTSEDCLVLALPLFHMHGLGVGIHGTLLAGGSAILVPEFSPDAVFDAIANYQASLFFGVPTMYTRLAASPRIEELSALRLCVSGSSPLPASLHETLRSRTGQEVLERYGMTETVMLVSNPHDDDRRGGMVGFPLPGVELRLDETSGEVEVRGPNVFSGYWRQPEATKAAFTDGWFHTGDIGEIDADGYLQLVGRSKELIITGGYNVYPREVEDVLRDHPEIADVAVAGTPDPEWGESVTAFVVAAPLAAAGGPTGEQLRIWIADRLASFKQPRRVILVDELPRNALGKVQRHRLPTSGPPDIPNPGPT
jgi:malonyl-CoA/methylmalonyl-CoA synthetase